MQYLISFSAGLLSFLSPCVFPLVPAYISYITGSSIEQLRTAGGKSITLMRSLGFVLGFSIIFIFMGTSISSIGHLLLVHQVLLRRLGGVFIVLMGIHTMGVIRLRPLYSEKRLLPFNPHAAKTGGSVLMGMAFAAGWTPCVGPILSSILLYASSLETIRQGTTLLIAYSLGLAVPFLITALTIDRWLDRFKRLTPYLPKVSLVSGLLLVSLGILIFTNSLVALNAFFDFLPVF